jgi:hypothetical protein
MDSVQSQRSAQPTTRTESFPGEEALSKLRQALEIEVRALELAFEVRADSG